MLSILAQSATSSTGDIASFLQSTFQQVIGIDVVMAFRILAVWIFLIWLVFAMWVAIDASARYKQWQIALLWFLFVLPFNVLGFIGYLFMRPVVTLDEHQWTKLESKYLMHELSSVNDCPKCGTLVPVTQNFCAVCGTSMNNVCPRCSSEQSIYNLYCTNCGEKLGMDETKTSTLIATYERVSILQGLGNAILSARDSVSKSASNVKEKLFKKREKKQEESKEEKKKGKKAVNAESAEAKLK